MTRMKSLRQGICMAVFFGCVQSAMAGVSGNVAVGSDYLWRGLTQTGHGAAVSGGVDYEHDSGLYAGTWTSNVALDTEIDFYGGFSKDFGNVGLELGGIYYAYPQPGALFSENFYELHGGISVSIVSVAIYYNPDGDYKGIYFTGGVDFAVKDDLTIGLNAGNAMPDNGDEYTHYGVSLTKSMEAGDFTLSVSDTDYEAGGNAAPLMTVSYSIGFDL